MHAFELEVFSEDDGRVQAAQVCLTDPFAGFEGVSFEPGDVLGMARWVRAAIYRRK